MTDDPYQKICSAMSEGLLITVNDSGGSKAPASDELRVVSAGDDVLLKDGNGGLKMLITRNQDTTLTDVDGQGHYGKSVFVETIEIVGISHRPN